MSERLRVRKLGRRRVEGALVALALGSVLLLASATQAAPNKSSNGKPDRVESRSDAAKSKLHPKLQKLVESGSTEAIYVFATVAGDTSAAESLLADAKVASSEGAALVIGKIGVQVLPKLAGAKGVVSVGPIEFEQTGQPLGQPDPDVGNTKNKALRPIFKKEVPYSEAPPPLGSNFEDLKDVALLDAKTHTFVEAWEAGFAGEGVTVGVLDGGTDFGHPDLLGTWQTWSGQTGSRAGWNGWPKAFDPYGTLVWLAAPSLVDQGLTWYTKTTAATCPDWANKSAKSPCPVQFETRTGPARNFSVPSGTNQHLYQFPAGFTKSGNVRMGSHPDDHLLALFGERPAFLVTDATTAGVYDTVYVDLDNDYRFDDEKPVTKASPVSYRDMNGDGYTDISGGLLYYISDGATAIPGGLDAFGVLNTSFGPGALLAWSGDYDPAIGGHGTLTASNIVGQGVAKGLAPTFGDYTDEYPGVIGGAPNAKLAPYGDIYFSFDFSTQFGYFLATRRGVDVTSNSYGSSAVDNDGYDAASQEADVIHHNTRTTALFSTGNGAPGFGTVAPPSPSYGIAVGASTQFGGTGWDSILNASQITDNDIIPWSNRGPGATGSPGVDVVADGAYSAGDVTLNAVLDGRFAWETWGGTSRSSPVAAGATALVYQAFRQASGSATVPVNFAVKAKEILKSSAQDLGYDTLIQGAGSVDAGEAVRTARALRPSVSPSEWRAGDYRGNHYSVFTHVMAPGGTDTQAFAVSGAGSFTASDSRLVRTGSETMTLTSANISAESPYNFNVPNYLIDLSDMVSDHSAADLMVVRLKYPNAEFDANGDVVQDQLWRILAYNWTDINGDGNLWTDTSGDGTVDFTQLGTSSNIDGFLDVNYATAEIDENEYVRLTYLNNASNSLMLFVRNPAERMADGLFLGLQHPSRSAAIPQTHFDIQVDFYENADWPWLSTSVAGNQVTANLTVPADAPHGVYSGAIELESAGRSIVVPVSVVVAATAALDADGKMTGSFTFGGADVAEAQADSLYNNGSIFGANTWQWRAESGDWRFFYFDVPTTPADGSLLLVNTTWDGAHPTDIDTLVFGRSANHFQVFGDAVFGAPYILDTVGGSPNRHLGSGRWAFDTATGEAADFVAAPMQAGLHALALHGVNWNAEKFDVPFEATVGGASVSPSSVVETTSTGEGSFEVTFSASVDLPGLSAEAFGLSQPSVTTETAHQDNPNDPSSASVKKDITLDHASRLTVRTQLGTDDLDLFVVYDANDDGQFTNAEIVASSTTGTSNEFIELVAPADGDYQVWVQGWSVSGTPSFTLTIDAIQGNDMTVSGTTDDPVPAGTPVTLTVEYSKPDMTVGQDYFGELLLGPPSAPTAMKVPIKVTRTG
jgi:hypothetical protein